MIMMRGVMGQQITGVLVLTWFYGTTVGARATYSGVKDEISGAKAQAQEDDLVNGCSGAYVYTNRQYKNTSEQSITLCIFHSEISRVHQHPVHPCFLRQCKAAESKPQIKKIMIVQLLQVQLYSFHMEVVWFSSSCTNIFIVILYARPLMSPPCLTQLGRVRKTTITFLAKGESNVSITEREWHNVLIPQKLDCQPLKIILPKFSKCTVGYRYTKTMKLKEEVGMAGSKSTHIQAIPTYRVYRLYNILFYLKFINQR